MDEPNNIMEPSASSPQERSNEWFRQSEMFGQFLCPALGDRSHQSVLKELTLTSSVVHRWFLDCAIIRH
jgi:hypothetical protein